MGRVHHCCACWPQVQASARSADVGGRVSPEAGNDGTESTAKISRQAPDTTAVHGVKDAIRRLNLYAEAGAGLLFADARHCVAAKFRMVAAR